MRLLEGIEVKWDPWGDLYLSVKKKSGQRHPRGDGRVRTREEAASHMPGGRPQGGTGLPTLVSDLPPPGHGVGRGCISVVRAAESVLFDAAAAAGPCRPPRYQADT